MKPLKACIHCGAWINAEFGKDSPAEHQEAKGTLRDPRAPGDYDNVCAPCNYGKGLSGDTTTPTDEAFTL